MKIRFADRLAVLLCATIILGNVAAAPDVLASAGEQGQEMDVPGKARPAGVRTVLTAGLPGRMALWGTVLTAGLPGRTVLRGKARPERT